MNNEIRNELLIILNYAKSTSKEAKQFHLNCLLERFENDINIQLEDLKHKQSELEDNLKTLEYVRKELEV